MKGSAGIKIISCCNLRACHICKDIVRQNAWKVMRVNCNDLSQKAMLISDHELQKGFCHTDYNTKQTMLVQPFMEKISENSRNIRLTVFANTTSTADLV